MKSVLIALCVASLTGCDGLSITQKKQGEAQAASAASAPQASAPVASKAAPRIDPDGELAARVKKALEGEPKLHAGGIDVTAAAGAVTLWGTAASDGERAQAAKLASLVDGVKSVENRIAVVKGS